MPQQQRTTTKRQQQIEQGQDFPGLGARKLAADLVFAVTQQGQPLDSLNLNIESAGLAREDRAFAYAITLYTIRHYGYLRDLVNTKLHKPLPKQAMYLEALLTTAMAQIIFLQTPHHAAVDLAVRLARQHLALMPYVALTNALLRGLAAMEAPPIDATKILPQWLHDRWVKTYGAQTTAAMVLAQLQEPPLDLTAKNNSSELAQKLNANLLPTGTLRLTSHKGPIPELEGFDEGLWWVQDAGALLPVLALGDVSGKNALDLCAAPGGKTAALISRGANVTAVDRSEQRLNLLHENLTRLNLKAEIICTDATKWDAPQLYDAILIDAPCSSTGTLRRHPDVAWSKNEQDIAKLSALQGRLLTRAVNWLKPGGVLVYSTCSLEPEEGEQQIENFVQNHQNMTRQSIKIDNLWPEMLDEQGAIRMRPDMLADSGGIDGFYAAKLVKTI